MGYKAMELPKCIVSRGINKSPKATRYIKLQTNRIRRRWAVDEVPLKMYNGYAD